MSFQNLNRPGQVDKLVKDLARQTGASVVRNARNTTPLIANNGNTYQPNVTKV